MYSLLTYIRLTVVILLLVCTSSCRDDDDFLPISIDHDIDITQIDDIYTAPNISLLMRKVCNWQLENPVAGNNGNGMMWARATFYTGVMATYLTTHHQAYLDAALRWASFQNWKLGKNPDLADDHTAGQLYTELYFVEGPSAKIDPTIQAMQQVMHKYKVGRELYWWADALFMSPPVFARLYAITGNRDYLLYLHQMWWDTYDFLYDTEKHLFYRDKWHFNDRTPNKEKVFWSRGNGWVIAGLVRVLQHIPKDDPYYEQYITLLQEMAASLADLQSQDGFWFPSLLDEEHAPYPETSGTAFFTYALAWGINEGHLTRETYLPIVRKGWNALVESIHGNGKLGWVQPGGSKPDTVTYDDYQEYGAGAFLLAGSEMYKLAY